MAKGRERCEMKSGNVIGCGDISIKTNSYSHRGNELFKIPFLEFTEAFRYQFGRANNWKVERKGRGSTSSVSQVN